MKKIVPLSIIIFSVLILQAGNRKKNAENLPLFNTKWILEEIYNEPVIHHNDTAFIIFTGNYKISGNLGCNLFFGNFSYGKKNLKLDYVGSTKKLCFDMQTENQFVKLLREDISNYYIEKDMLYIRNNNKKIVAVFRGIPVPNQQKDDY